MFCLKRRHVLLVLAVGAMWVLANAAPAAESPPQVTVYLQLRATDPNNDASYLSLRRFKVKVDGRFDATSGYYLQAIHKLNNRSGTDGQPHVQDLRVWRQRGQTRLTLGQTKPAFGRERFVADTKLPLIDRSPATDHLIPGGSLGKSFSRDRGIIWDWPVGSAACTVGLFEGSGANANPHGVGPLLTARAVLKRKTTAGGEPLQVHLEGALAWRQARDLNFSKQLPGTEALGYNHFSGHDRRLDLAAGMRGPRWELQAEYLRAEYRSAADKSPAINADGFYVQGGCRLGSKLEVALKYDEFNTHHAYELHQTTCGLNWYLDDNREKLQLNYVDRGSRKGQRPADAWACQYQRFF